MVTANVAYLLTVEELTDAELLAAAGEGDCDAFGVVFRRHVRPITGYQLPVAVTAVRALRSMARHAAHAVGATALAVLMVVSWQLPTGETASVAIGRTPETHGYISQHASPTGPSPIERARNQGYEVTVLRTFVPDRAAHGEILATRHPGPISPGSARGPLLFVIGYSIGSDSASVN